MRSTLVNILACPVCKSHPLDLTVEKKDDEDVVEGSLRCPQCKAEYPIVDGIPDMIPPKDR